MLVGSSLKSRPVAETIFNALVALQIGVNVLFLGLGLMMFIENKAIRSDGEDYTAGVQIYWACRWENREDGIGKNTPSECYMELERKAAQLGLDIEGTRFRDLVEIDRIRWSIPPQF